MPASLENTLSSVASGLEDTSPSFMDDDVPIRPTPPSTVTTSSMVVQETGKAKEKWWEWLAHKAEGIEEWVEGFVGNHTGKDGEGKVGTGGGE
jgi:hypothetical protein